MPGWYIHMDVARKALDILETNDGARRLFAEPGPSPAELTELAHKHPAYAALGAIGPDIFFLLPDFKPPLGQMLWGAADLVKDIYEKWDENVLGPCQDQLGPIAMNQSNELDGVSGGLIGQLSDIASSATSFLLEAMQLVLIRQYDVFSLLGSGVPQGYDEQTFFWSDMLHYRKTYEFAAHLWKKATDQVNNESDPERQAELQRLQAFALGWMSHLAADVTGHSFVNEKAGGPYRLHWQRHHLVENHMDSKVYDTENGTGSTYQMLSCAALHLWLAFNPDGSSRVNFFDSQPGPNYSVDPNTGGVLNRRHNWDVDSDLPKDLANFLAEGLKEVYNAEFTGSADPHAMDPSATDLPEGQCAAHPTIIEDYSPGSEGYASAENIRTTYWWLYHYVKLTTTDYFSMLRPEQPSVFEIPEPPSPPGAGVADVGPGAHDHNAWHNFLEIFLAIFAWIFYLGQVVIYLISLIPAIIASGISYPVRDLLYVHVELPLYNAWAALHWYLAMTGFVYPMQQEINDGMVTLGLGIGDVWGSVQAALDDLDGGLHIPPMTMTEPSGSAGSQNFPIDVVLDPPGTLSAEIDTHLRHIICGATETPSEFMRPWLWPDVDNDGHRVPREQPLSQAGPYRTGQDVTDLMGNVAGDARARKDFESSGSEAETIRIAQTGLPLGKHLGDPIDYTCYVIAKLTRNDLQNPANFNLDSDRGYGYLCWDWVRNKEVVASPSAWAQEDEAGAIHHHTSDARAYEAPLRPGAGWCHEDLAEDNGIIPTDQLPHEHSEVTEEPVRIRYIDREVKYSER